MYMSVILIQTTFIVIIVLDVLMAYSLFSRVIRCTDPVALNLDSKKSDVCSGSQCPGALLPSEGLAVF
jgi:hypothetical protein